MDFEDYVKYAVQEFKFFWTDVYKQNCLKKNFFAIERAYKFEGGSKGNK